MVNGRFARYWGVCWDTAVLWFNDLLRDRLFLYVSPVVTVILWAFVRERVLGLLCRSIPYILGDFFVLIFGTFHLMFTA